MPKTTLRKFLENERLKCYEDIAIFREKMAHLDEELITEEDRISIEVAEAKLNLIKSAIDICENRGRY